MIYSLLSVCTRWTSFLIWKVNQIGISALPNIGMNTYILVSSTQKWWETSDRFRKPLHPVTCWIWGVNEPNAALGYKHVNIQYEMVLDEEIARRVCRIICFETHCRTKAECQRELWWAWKHHARRVCRIICFETYSHTKAEGQRELWWAWKHQGGCRWHTW